MKQLMPWALMRSTFAFIFSRSAFSSSASLPVDLHLDPRPEDLDLVRVHGCVGDEDLGILEALRLVDAELLVEDEALVEIGVGKLAAGLLDDLDVGEIGGASHTQDGVAGEVCEIVPVLREDFGGEGGAGDGEEVFAEARRVFAVVDGVLLERL